MQYLRIHAGEPSCVRPRARHHLRVGFPTVSNPVLRARALLDTGAFGGNLIRADMARALLSLNLATEVAVDTQVCDFANKCNVINSLLHFRVAFMVETKQKERYITLEAVIVKDCIADVIIGRDGIMKHKLVKRCPSQFYKMTEHQTDSYGVEPLRIPSQQSKGGAVSERQDTPVPTSPAVDVTTNGAVPPAIAGGSVQAPDASAEVVAADIAVNLVVSKATLLHGADDDDDEIDLPEIPITSEEDRFEDIEVTDLEGDAFREEQRSILRQAFDEAGIFKSTLGDAPISAEPLKLVVDTEKWFGEARNRQPPRMQSSVKQEFIRAVVKELPERGCIGPCQAPAFSQVHVVPKKDPGTWRFCIDFRALNEATKSNSWTIPNIKLMLQRLGDKKPKYFAVMDLTSGYWQAPIDKDSQEFTAFRTASGTYCWKRVPMGLKGAGSYFQQQMCNIIGSDLLYNGVEVYLDDVIVYGATEAEYLANLRALLKKFADNGVRLSPRKCRFGLREVEYVGHVINSSGRTFSDKKKLKVLNFPKPQLHKHLKSYLGLCNYFRDVIPNYATEFAPLQKLILSYSKGKAIAWTSETEACFEKN